MTHQVLRKVCRLRDGTIGFDDVTAVLAQVAVTRKLATVIGQMLRKRVRSAADRLGMFDGCPREHYFAELIGGSVGRRARVSFSQV